MKEDQASASTMTSRQNDNRQDSLAEHHYSMPESSLQRPISGRAQLAMSSSSNSNDRKEEKKEDCDVDCNNDWPDKQTKEQLAAVSKG